MTTTALLAPLRARAGSVRTNGLDDATVDRLAAKFPELRAAVATHPFEPHTERIFHVSLPGGSCPGWSAPVRPIPAPARASSTATRSS